MYVAFDIRVVEMSLVGFVLQDREYFHPRFLLHGVDRTQKLDLSNIGLGADFLSAELIIGVSDEIEGRTFFGLIHGSIDPEHTTSVDRESEAFPQLRHHEHHVAIEIGLSKSNLETFADHMKHLRLTKVAVDTDVFTRAPKYEDKLFRFAEPMFSSKGKQDWRARFDSYRFGFEYPVPQSVT